MQFARSGSATSSAERTFTHEGETSTAADPLHRVGDTLGFTTRKRPNVGAAERIVSALGGAGLLLQGIRSRGVGGLLMAVLGAELLRRGVTGRSMLYDQIGVDTSAAKPSKAEDFFRRGIHVEESISISRPREEIYRFWRNFENLPRFMQHLEKVEVIDERLSHWTARGPTGHVEWNAEIINEEPGRLIAWRSLLGADVDHRGSVTFRDAPQGRGTEIKVVLDYIPPAGRVGAAVAKLFGEEPEMQIRDDLRRLREILETGEIATIEGQPSGRLGGRDIRTPSGEGWSRPAGISAAQRNERTVYTGSGPESPELKGGMTDTPSTEPLIERREPGAPGSEGAGGSRA